jgi:hypothetical protein
MSGKSPAVSIWALAMFVAVGSASAADAPKSDAPAAAAADKTDKNVTAEPATPAAAITTAPVDAQALKDAIRVQAVEVREHVNDAKERNYLAKLKLHTFNEEVLKNLEPPGGARLTIVHRNEMAGGYTMIGIAYALDGAQIYSKLDPSGSLDERGQIPILDAKVIPGEHQLAVQYDVKGNGGGVFAYLNDLRVVLRRAYTFKVDTGKETRLVGTLGTNNGFGELYEDRPIIGFTTLVVDLPKPAGATIVASTEAKAAATTAEAPPADAAAPAATPAASEPPPPPPADGK